MKDPGNIESTDLSSFSAFEAFHLACLAFGGEDLASAAEYTRAANAKAPESAVFHHAARYLRQVLHQDKTSVYIDGEAFAAFIRGGSNRCLYEKTSAALHAVYTEYHSLDLLDIGVGDGLALLPALCENIQHLSILEPSALMLQRCRAALGQRGAPSFQAIQSTIQHFMQSNSGHWDLIESTFCLQNIPPEERLEVLTWMQAHGKRLLLVEFDVPAFPDLYAPERVRFLVDRYEKGLAEYADDGELVAQGFLMPVMLGNFDRTGARNTYEQPIECWEADLKMAGYRSVKSKPIFPYWWSTAYLLDAF